MWRQLTITDLTATLSAAEIEAYRQSVGDTFADVAQALLNDTAAEVRGYIRRNYQVRMVPDVYSIPASCVSAACDIAAFKILKRFPNDMPEPRKLAYKRAIEMLEQIAKGDIIPESDGEVDPETTLARPYSVEPAPRRLLGNLNSWLPAVVLMFAISMLPSSSRGSVLSEAWDVDVNQPPEPHEITVLAGETVDVSCRFVDAGVAVSNFPAQARFYWQTNGMERVFWVTDGYSVASNATAGVVFQPNMYPFTDGYIRFYIEAKAEDNQRVFRGFGMLRVRYSPGAVPNEIPFPLPVLDFEHVDVLHPLASPFIVEEVDPLALPIAEACQDAIDEIEPWIHEANGRIVANAAGVATNTAAIATEQARAEGAESILTASVATNAAAAQAASQAAAAAQASADDKLPLAGGTLSGDLHMPYSSLYSRDIYGSDDNSRPRFPRGLETWSGIYTSEIYGSDQNSRPRFPRGFESFENTKIYNTAEIHDIKTDYILIKDRTTGLYVQLYVDNGQLIVR